jgi:hypothetical protein
VDETTANGNEPDLPTTGVGGEEAEEGDFELCELLQAYQSDFDHEGRRIDRTNETSEAQSPAITHSQNGG